MLASSVQKKLIREAVDVLCVSKNKEKIAYLNKVYPECLQLVSQMVCQLETKEQVDEIWQRAINYERLFDFRVTSSIKEALVPIHHAGYVTWHKSYPFFIDNTLVALALVPVTAKAQHGECMKIIFSPNTTIDSATLLKFTPSFLDEIFDNIMADCQSLEIIGMQAAGINAQYFTCKVVNYVSSLIASNKTKNISLKNIIFTGIDIAGIDGQTLNLAKKNILSLLKNGFRFASRILFPTFSIYSLRNDGYILFDSQFADTRLTIFDNDPINFRLRVSDYLNADLPDFVSSMRVKSVIEKDEAYLRDAMANELRARNIEGVNLLEKLQNLDTNKNLQKSDKLQMPKIQDDLRRLVYYVQGVLSACDIFEELTAAKKDALKVDLKEIIVKEKNLLRYITNQLTKRPREFLDQIIKGPHKDFYGKRANEYISRESGNSEAVLARKKYLQLKEPAHPILPNLPEILERGYNRGNCLALYDIPPIVTSNMFPLPYTRHNRNSMRNHNVELFSLATPMGTVGTMHSLVNTEDLNLRNSVSIDGANRV